MLFWTVATIAVLSLCLGLWMAFSYLLEAFSSATRDADQAGPLDHYAGDI